MVNYKNGKLYKLTNSVNDDIYIGSTAETTLARRMTNHRKDAKTRKSYLYQQMRLIGIENFKIVLLEDYPCENKDQLRAKEDEWIQRLKPKLNQVRAYRTDEELRDYKAQYYNEHKDKLLNQSIKYYEEHKDERLDYQAKYRDEHRDKINERQAMYYLEHKDERLEYQTKYRQDNKERINAKQKEKIICDICQCKIRKDSKAKHEQSKKHIANTKQTNTEQSEENTISRPIIMFNDNTSDKELLPIHSS